MNGSISFGYYVSGTVIPTQIDQHYAYLNGNAEVETTGLTIPVIPSVGLPGLSYPGLLTIGPYYEINFGLTGDISLDGTINAVTGFSLPVVDISIGNSSDPQTNSQGTNYADVTLSNNVQLSAGLTISLIPQLGVGVSVLNGLVNADVSLQPSAGLTAGGQININVTTGEPSDPCVELVGDVNLDWVVGGKLGPWGAAVTGQIWGIQKTLWQQCFDNSSKKRDLIRLVSDDEWKEVTNNHRPPIRFARTLDSLVCPAVNPFTNSP
ncbi:hypothetical protein BC937DRAFT_88307 [Endogone sp. FLAS-F59071]|nr:hypothetical protein BC937DRAFT_88307 [Endogone sp. FLAS-F59071]|eukprot:RUS18820.1 hypothetical protein BC937DRAFT_88307 [Endogone sp. FLAS-F59071]